VYVGAPRFGAREAAGNSIADIEKLAGYAHRMWARVYAAVNILLRDDELAEAEHLCQQLHQAGVDGLIIQDVGLLECNLPASAFDCQHADATTTAAERVAFWEKVVSRAPILARELDLDQIRAIRTATSIELEASSTAPCDVSMSGHVQPELCAGRSQWKPRPVRPTLSPLVLLAGCGGRNPGARQAPAVRCAI